MEAEVIPANRSRKRPKGTPTHVGRIRLDPSVSQSALMVKRGLAEDRVYNACLCEAKKRLALLRTDSDFERAKAMPSGPKRTALFRKLDKSYEFTERSLMSYGSSLRKSWIRPLVGAQEAQVEARNAFRTVERWSFGNGGKPKFRSYRKRKVLSAECKDLNGDIKPVLVDGRLWGISWTSKFLIPLAKPQSHSEALEQERIASLVLSGKLRYCRVVSRLINNRWCHEAQLVLDGPAPLRYLAGQQSMVCIDSGPSMFHVVYDTGSAHIPLAPSIDNIEKRLRVLQRHLDRQHRSGSPKCFDEKDRHIKGACYWKNRSKQAQKTQAQIAEIHRILAARRDSDHGRMANTLIEISSNIRTEDHGMKSWQQGFYSRQMQHRAPGSALDRIKRAAERAGGSYNEVDSRLALSQVCICGKRHKKSLSQRRHTCEEYGLDLDRDMFSAFLMRHVEIDGSVQTLDLDAARAELISSSDGIHKVGAGGHPCDSTTKRQDIGARPDETRSESEKRKSSNRRPPGKRSLVRIRKRRMAKANGTSDSTARPEDGVSALAENQPLPTARVA